MHLSQVTAYGFVVTKRTSSCFVSMTYAATILSYCHLVDAGDQHLWAAPMVSVYPVPAIAQDETEDIETVT